MSESSGAEVVALDHVDLEVSSGEFVALVGPSGCGKSTLLMLLAGLVPATDGKVTIDGSVVTAPRRSVGVMFQTSELFAWRSVLDNVLLPVDVFKLPRSDFQPRARELLEIVGLGDFEDFQPYELSGGMQQRAALCRLFVTDPSVVLMDEPFGSLDEFTRERLNLELLRLIEATRKTVVFVTHNIGEAVLLSDRVIVMRSEPGRIIESVPIGLPRPRSQRSMRDAQFQETVFKIRALLGLEAQ